LGSKRNRRLPSQDGVGGVHPRTCKGGQEMRRNPKKNGLLKGRITSFKDLCRVVKAKTIVNRGGPSLVFGFEPGGKWSTERGSRCPRSEGGRIKGQRLSKLTRRGGGSQQHPKPTGLGKEKFARKGKSRRRGGGAGVSGKRG